MSEHCCKNNPKHKAEGQCCKSQKECCVGGKIMGFFKNLFGGKNKCCQNKPEGECCKDKAQKTEGCCKDHTAEKEANGQCCKQKNKENQK